MRPAHYERGAPSILFITGSPMHVMLDIETLATSPDAVVLSIGAAAFSVRDGLAPVQFYSVVSLDEQAERAVDPDTVVWWMRQARENPAASDVFEAEHEPLLTALQRLTGYFGAFSSPNDGVWANGPDFDCVILRTLFDEAGLRTPWRHTQHRCFRTLRSLTKQLNLDVKVHENMRMHNALADADWQARFTVSALRDLGVTA